MISEDIQILDLDATHWANLIKLSRGEFYEHRKKKQGEGRATLVIIHKDGKALKANHSGKGIIRGFDFPGADKLDDLAKREDVQSILLIERGAPRRFMHDVQSRLSLEGNMVQQGLTIYDCIREHVENKGFIMWPERPLREVKYSAVLTMLKIALPTEEVIIIVVFDSEGKAKDLSGFPIVTSLVLGNNSKYELNLISTTDALVPDGLTMGDDWRKDYKNIIQAAKKKWGKVFLGFFSDVAGMAELDRTPPLKQAKALLEMEKEKKIILDPFPMRLKMMLKMGGMVPGGKKK